MNGLRTAAALGAVLLLAGCGADPTTAPPAGPPAPSPAPTPTLVLDRVEHVVAPSGYPDVVTGCLPGTTVRVFLGEQGFYSGLHIAAITDATCVQPLGGPGQ